MKVMITENIEIDLDLTNGAQGEIVDIALHPDEPPIGDKPVVHLEYMPAYILIKLSRTRTTTLEGTPVSYQLSQRRHPIESTFSNAMENWHKKMFVNANIL